MSNNEIANYNRIAEAIKYIKENFREQPDLGEVAKQINLSPFHFQRLFTEWAGVSPKQFLQYTNIAYAKRLLKEKQSTLFDTAFETGLSGTGRLHDLFIKIEGMTPGEFKNGGENLLINYNFAQTPFGNILIASTGKGICFMTFADDEATGFTNLQKHFPKANFTCAIDAFQKNALSVFQQDWSKLNGIKLHLKGTDFQIKVWETLLKIPHGNLSTYGAIADQIGTPQAARAVGTAIGSNPVAFLIPCHRVIQSSGGLGGYMWGPVRKTAMIGWEAALENRRQKDREHAADSTFR